MEHINCVICGTDNIDLIHTARDWMEKKHTALFNIVRCRNCGLVYLNPRLTPEEIEEYYPEQYFSNTHTVTRLLKKIVANNEIKQFKEIIGDKAKILEIGCGTGEYLRHLKDNMDGWDVYGIDTSQFAVKIAKEKFNLDIFFGNILESNFKDDFFDLVIMKHVIEHIHNLEETIKKINALLKENVKLCLWLPCIDGIESKIFGRYWAGFDVPRHLYSFSENTLSKFLTKNGFKIIKTKYDFVPNYWLTSTHHLLVEKKMPVILTDFFNDKKNFILLGMFFPLSLFLSWLGKSGQIKMVVQKI